MALYEHVLIARQDISPQQVDALVEEVGKAVAELGGSVGKTEYWGLRNLAYRVRKNRKGHYAMMNIVAPPAAIAEIERRLRINEDVLRYLTVKVEEHDTEASPILARRDRDERRRQRRDGERDGDDGDDRGGRDF